MGSLYGSLSGKTLTCTNPRKNCCIANANAVCDLCIIRTLITDFPKMCSLIKHREWGWYDGCEADRISQYL